VHFRYWFSFNCFSFTVTLTARLSVLGNVFVLKFYSIIRYGVLRNGSLGICNPTDDASLRKFCRKL
jgi:hypothetical protein